MVRKVPTLFERDESRRYVVDQVAAGCEWVLAGEGVATRKYDGACCMVDQDGRFWKRRDVKPGQIYPPGFVSVEADPVTGKDFGWVPVGDGPEDRWFKAAYEGAVAALVACGDGPPLRPGTYELIGPKVNGNPERVETHLLVPHAAAEKVDAPRSFAELAEVMPRFPFEGVVWHHPDGRMAKVKRRDFPKAAR